MTSARKPSLPSVDTPRCALLPISKRRCYSANEEEREGLLRFQTSPTHVLWSLVKRVFFLRWQKRK